MLVLVVAVAVVAMIRFLRGEVPADSVVLFVTMDGLAICYTWKYKFLSIVRLLDWRPFEASTPPPPQHMNKCEFQIFVADNL